MLCGYSFQAETFHLGRKKEGGAGRKMHRYSKLRKLTGLNKFRTQQDTPSPLNKIIKAIRNPCWQANLFDGTVCKLNTALRISFSKVITLAWVVFCGAFLTGSCQKPFTHVYKINSGKLALLLSQIPMELFLLSVTSALK